MTKTPKELDDEEFHELLEQMRDSIKTANDLTRRMKTLLKVASERQQDQAKKEPLIFL